jgi:hypothetical protein
MGDQRSAQAGALNPIRSVTTAIGVIAAGAVADVALPADAAFGDPGGVAFVVEADFDGAPGDPSLGIVAAWVSDPVLGVVTVRFSSTPGPTGAVAAQKLLIARKPRG